MRNLADSGGTGGSTGRRASEGVEVSVRRWRLAAVHGVEGMGVVRVAADAAIRIEGEERTDWTPFSGPRGSGGGIAAEWRQRCRGPVSTFAVEDFIVVVNLEVEEPRKVGDF